MLTLPSLHDDVIKWKHFPRYCPFVRGIHWSNFPHKGQWRGVLLFSLICAWTNGWANNRDAGDLRRNRAHYDVTAMSSTGGCHNDNRRCQRLWYICYQEYSRFSVAFVIQNVSSCDIYHCVPFCLARDRSLMTQRIATMQHTSTSNIPTAMAAWMPTDIEGTENECTHVEFIKVMMTSSNGNIFRVTGPLWGESIWPFVR